MRTHAIRILLTVAALTWGGIPGQSWAGSIAEDEAAVAQADNDLFNAVVAGKGNTIAERQKLKADTVDKAAFQISQDIQNSWVQALTASSQGSHPPIAIEESTWQLMQAQLDGGKNANRSTASTRAHKSSDSNPYSRGTAGTVTNARGKAEVILDGKGIPRVLDFTKGAKSSSD